MAFCTNCGNKLEDGAKFCTSCGTRGDTAEAGGAVKSGLSPLNAGDETKPEAWLLAGMKYGEKGEHSKAASAYSKAIELSPKDPRFYMLRSIAYLNTKEYDKAEADQSEAVRLEPNNGMFYYIHGDWYDTQKEYNKARAEYTKALETGGLDTENSIECYRRRAVALVRQVQFDSAIADFEAALKLAPGNKELLDGLELTKAAKVKYAQTQKESCGTQAETSASETNNAEAAFEQGAAYLKNQDIPKAIECFTKVIELDETYPGVWTKRGEAYMLDDRCENYDKALSDFNRAIELDESDGEAYGFRAEINWRYKNKDEALEDLSIAFDYNSDSYLASADYMFNEGAELPDDIIQALKDEGFIDDDDEDEDD